MILQPYLNKQDVITCPNTDPSKLNCISRYKEVFLQKQQDPEIYNLLAPEVADSWQRCKKLQIDPQMQELTYVRRFQEMEALLHDNRAFIDLTKLNFCTLLPLLDIPTTLTIFEKNGTLLDLLDEPNLLRLNLRSGSIWREETVGTSSTSISIEYGKMAQLAGSEHYCNALEHQFATTTPVFDSNGEILGLITIINHVRDALLNETTLNKILLWTNTLRFTVETQMQLRKRSFIVDMELRPSSAKCEALTDHKTLQNTPVHPFSNIIGESPQIIKAIRTAVRFAKTNNNILIFGESGTGKELFAQAIHQASGRTGAFVAINCAGLPSNLIASELFGYTGGAFTGADVKGRTGKIELAQNGTLFLDEIGDLPLELQPLFLRVLEEKKVTPLGSNKAIPVDFRLIAATNRDLFQLVQENKFRADLYYRLEVLELELPPLQARDGDILLLAEYFLENTCREANLGSLKLSKEVKDFLSRYPWPGNIRQLKNAVVYAANTCEEDVIRLQDLPKTLSRNLVTKTGKITSVKETEEQMIRRALSMTGNNVRAAASIVGLSKTTVYRRIKEYGIDLNG